MKSTPTTRLQRMQCMEILGGNQALDLGVQAPGVDLYMTSQPYRENESGGDICYLTSCASGRITRILLADVSGHGETVSNVAISLRDLMRASVNKISQENFITTMNREFLASEHESQFATAVVLTIFEPSRRLSFGLAGHPPPLYYRAKRDNWTVLNASEPGLSVPGNLPLGILAESRYPARDLRTPPGDRFLVYSDSLIESLDEKGRGLGIEGLRSILNGLPRSTPTAELPNLIQSKIRELNPDNLSDDDTTLILGEFTRTKPSLFNNLLAPFRLFWAPRDRTQLATESSSM